MIDHHEVLKKSGDCQLPDNRRQYMKSRSMVDAASLFMNTGAF
jgi:hypothetical protein